MATMVRHLPCAIVCVHEIERGGHPHYLFPSLLNRNIVNGLYAIDHLAINSDAVKVKEWRHKLQRAFLSKSIPKEEVRRASCHLIFLATVQSVLLSTFASLCILLRCP